MIKLDFSHTVQELELILAGLRKLPMELVVDLHNKLNVEGKKQFDAHPENPANQVKPDTPETSQA
jgi:hypothetical protein